MKNENFLYMAYFCVSSLSSIYKLGVENMYEIGIFLDFKKAVSKKRLLQSR